MDGVGEVAANGRNVFMGYLEDPAKTRNIDIICYNAVIPYVQYA